MELIFKPGVPLDVQREVRKFCRNVKEVIDLQHEISIIVIPSSVAGVETSVCHGGFLLEGSKPLIIVGGRPDTEYDYTVEGIIDTVAHELVHYEQWRDGREFTERGVKVRARSIMKKCKVIG